MIQESFPVQRSMLSVSALTERVLSRYDLPGSPTCHFWHRSINDGYRVEAGGSRFVLRITPANWRSREQMSAEIDLLHHLYGHDISVPQPVQQMDGTYIQTLNAPEGPRHAVLFTFVPGAAPDATEEASHRYGQAIARFHAATDSYPTDRAGFRFEPVDMVDKPLARLRPFFADHEDDYDYLLAISTKLKRAADTLARNAPAYGVCHGDVNASNFHLDDGEGWALFDFEYFGYGWRIFDIGTFQHWVFELCMPFIREWIEDPW